MKTIFFSQKIVSFILKKCFEKLPWNKIIIKKNKKKIFNFLTNKKPKT